MRVWEEVRVDAKVVDSLEVNKAVEKYLKEYPSGGYGTKELSRTIEGNQVIVKFVRLNSCD